MVDQSKIKHAKAVLDSLEEQLIEAKCERAQLEVSILVNEEKQEVIREKITTQEKKLRSLVKPAGKSKTLIHVSLSVREVLTWPDDKLKEICHRYSPSDMRVILMDHLEKGHEVIPLDACDNFDWKDGCKGHEVEESK